MSITVERQQTGVRIEKNLLKVLKAYSEYRDITLGDLLEGIVLHVFENKLPFDAKSVKVIQELSSVYGMNLTAEESHNLSENADVIQETTFTPSHVSHTSTFVIERKPDEIFHLFTPVGEKLWAEGWDPVFLVPPNGEPCEDAVFLTSHDGENKIWLLKRFEPHTRITYYRINPESAVGTVDITVKPERNVSSVTVSYSFTALAEKGNEFVSKWTADYYARFIDSWKTDIDNYLAGRRASHHH